MKVLHSFTARILAIMVALLLLFCAVSTLAWYRSFTREAVETAQAHLDTVIETLNETFEESLREIDYTTAFISNKVRSTQNNCVVQFLTAQESNAQIASLQQARSYLFNRCNFKAYLNGVSIYGFDGRICTYGITTPYDEVSQTEWFSQIQSGQADVVYLTPHAYTSKQPSPKSSYVFSIVRPVLNNGTIIGVIKADVKSSLLETIFDIQEMQGYALYVFDRDTGEAVYVPEGADTLPLTRFQDSVPRGHGSYTDQIGGADCLVVYTTSEITPWQIVGVVRQNTVISGFLQVRNRMLLWMFLHDTVDLIGKLAVQRRNRVRDLDLRACVFTGEQDTERRGKQHPNEQDHHNNGNSSRAACADSCDQLFCRCRDCPQDFLSSLFRGFGCFDCCIPKYLPFADDSCGLLWSSRRRFAGQGFCSRCGELDFRFRGCFDLLLFYKSRSCLLLDAYRFCRDSISACWYGDCFIRQCRLT